MPEREKSDELLVKKVPGLRNLLNMFDEELEAVEALTIYLDAYAKAAHLDKCYGGVYTGPNSVTRGSGRKVTGKPLQARQMKLASMSIRSIAHVATKHKWPTWVNTYPYLWVANPCGYEYRKKWAHETLVWWDKTAAKNVKNNGEAALKALMADLLDKSGEK
ncbi:hypothetical protein CERSUDRAFT_78706 [Gelatoporia subvermispora B]|uniref:Uncharacterized protein n=1 Tax=Ceriporiopsis subvermispora (strain B) TaxID=914234 RepID=M2Q1D6_CERS8|nr:hypothetical protein CERSUDRAFT_78706 [Gelatoporia subvermispora B]